MSSAPFLRADALIGRLRITGTRGDPVSARLRAARLLDADVFRPPGLPPSAILCIRALRDPLPGQFPMSSSAIRPPGNWSRALASRVETLARYARRPALDSAVDDAPAVLFLDPGELIACLARDWLDGKAISRWWWQHWLRGAGVEAALISLCEQHPIDLPAALDHLARSGDIVPFARRLSPVTIERLIGHLLATFDLPDLRAALTDRAAPPIGESDQMPPAEPQAPWERIAPESADFTLTPASRCLIGIGLTLARAPLIARRPEFAESARRWARHQIAPQSTAAETSHYEHIDPAPPHMDILAAPDRADASSRQMVETLAQPSPDAAKPIATPTEAPDDREAVPPTVSVSESVPSAEASTPLAEAAADLRPASADAIHTAYGGIFYLVNLALYLGLYGDASTPRSAGIHLPLWDLVALVGERWIGDALHADPVWALLARLAGRAETDAPGQDFTTPDRWQIPADWLRAFPEPGIWRWGVSGDRLLIDHPAGFRAVDVPLSKQDTITDLLHHLTEPYREITAFELERAPLVPPASTGLTRWLDWLMSYVDARLKRALNTQEPVGVFLCRYPARIYATGAHLDIVLSLQALPIEIRFAGLDRDPGWIPAAAAIIRFHFE